MSSWKDVTAAAPDIAGLARARVEATGLALMATLRRDGFPRVSGVEPVFAGDELWLGMMPGSRKARDLLRDDRLCLHNATVDKDVSEGDIKITGRAVEADAAGRDRFRQEVKARSGFDPGEDFHAFTVDVTEVSTVRPDPAAQCLIVEWWREGQNPQRVERR